MRWPPSDSIALILVGLFVLFVLFTVIRSIPDINRYRRLKAM